MNNITPRYIREKTVAELIGISVATLQKHRQKGVGLPYVKFRGAILYSFDEVMMHLDELKRGEAHNAA